MKALIYNGPCDVRVKEVPDAKIEKPTDAVIRITSTNICGSDLHMYMGRTDFEKGRVELGKVEPSFIVSHELPLDEAPDAYKHFDARDEGWTKVILKPAGERSRLPALKEQKPMKRRVHNHTH